MEAESILIKCIIIAMHFQSDTLFVVYIDFPSFQESFLIIDSSCLYRSQSEFRNGVL